MRCTHERQFATSSDGQPKGDDPLNLPKPNYNVSPDRSQREVQNGLDARTSPIPLRNHVGICSTKAGGDTKEFGYGTLAH
jgi:hypothetical protein